MRLIFFMLIFRKINISTFFKRPFHFASYSIVFPWYTKPRDNIQFPRPAVAIVPQSARFYSNMVSPVTSYNLCSAAGCGNPSKLQCPKCCELQLQPSYFCSQECFKRNWQSHKSVHERTTDTNSLNKATGKEDINSVLSPRMAVRAFPQTPRRTIPDHIQRPDYSETGIPQAEKVMRLDNKIKVLSAEDIRMMRIAGRLGREVLNEASKHVRPGVTTDEIDRIVHEACIARNCYPSPLNYRGFPKSCCTSVNEVICHGIPDLRPLQDGDILNIDVAVFYQGYHADLNETYLVGNVDETGRKLVRVTRECLMKAIEICRPGTRYRELGDVIQKHAHSQGLSVVRAFTGHGVHTLFHTTPTIPHYANNKAIGVMQPGHCFTIEPMINEGTYQCSIWPDDWTAVTVDGKRSAQFEQTLLITETGVEILSK